MSALFGIILVLAIFIGLYAALSPVKPITVQDKCKKQPHLLCPVTKTVRGKIIEFGGHSNCCMYRSQLKAMNKAFCQMEPGVNYNGMSITESVKQQALKKKEYFENLDDTGPAGYKNNESIPKHNNQD